MWGWRLRGCFAPFSAVKADYIGLLVLFLPGGYAMLMRRNKADTAVHGCHCLGDMDVRMRNMAVRIDQTEG